MKRAVSSVAKEIGVLLKNFDEFGPKQGKNIVVPRDTVVRWLLLLCPPKTGLRKTQSDRKVERRTTRKRLDALCREIIFRRDGNQCRKCGRTDRQLQWCHVYAKGAHPWLRWDLDNSFCGCSHCHMNWWHARPTEAMEWWEKEIGAAAMQALRLRAAKPRRAEPSMVKIYLESRGREIRCFSPGSNTPIGAKAPRHVG